jgi:hypothetical protein
VTGLLEELIAILTSLVVAEVRERLLVSKYGLKNLDVEVW